MNLNDEGRSNAAHWHKVATESLALLRELLDWMPRVSPAAGQEDEWEAAVNKACELLKRHNVRGNAQATAAQEHANGQE